MTDKAPIELASKENNSPSAMSKEVEAKDNGLALVSYQDFTKIQLRIGVIEKAEKIEKSEKLLKLSVNLGSALGSKQILAGISKYYTPEALINKRIVVVANLSPAKLMGHVSEGMLLAASNENGDLELVSVSDIFDGGSVVR